MTPSPSPGRRGAGFTDEKRDSRQLSGAGAGGAQMASRLFGGRSGVPLRWQAGDCGRHLGQRGGRGHPGAPRAASVCATDRAGAKSRLRFYVSGNGSSRGRRRDDVARAEVCRDNDAREVRGLGDVVFPSPARWRRGRGRGCLAGSGFLVLAPESSDFFESGITSLISLGCSRSIWRRPTDFHI
jgi:hypothetical protein